MPATHNISTKRGVTLSRVFRFKNGADLIDLTGKTFVFKVRAGALTIRKETGVNDGLSIDDPAAGEVALNLSPAETRSLHLGHVNPYEFEVREPNGSQDVWLEGYFNVSDGINDDA